MKKIIKIHGDDPERGTSTFTPTLCGNWGKGKEAVYYRIPYWLFENLVLDLLKGKENQSLCTDCVKEQLFFDWKKGIL